MMRWPLQFIVQTKHAAFVGFGFLLWTMAQLPSVVTECSYRA